MPLSIDLDINNKWDSSAQMYSRKLGESKERNLVNRILWYIMLDQNTNMRYPRFGEKKMLVYEKDDKMRGAELEIIHTSVSHRNQAGKKANEEKIEKVM